jgi:hypothetical protein
LQSKSAKIQTLNNLLQFQNSISEDIMKNWNSAVSLVDLRQPPKVLPKDQRSPHLRNGGQEIMINNKESN